MVVHLCFFCLVNILKRLRQCLYGKGRSSRFCLGKWTLSVAFSLKPSLKKKESSSSPLLHRFLFVPVCTLHYRMECPLCKKSKLSLITHYLHQRIRPILVFQILISGKEKATNFTFYQEIWRNSNSHFFKL